MDNSSWTYDEDVVKVPKKGFLKIIDSYASQQSSAIAFNIAGKILEMSRTCPNTSDGSNAESHDGSRSPGTAVPPPPGVDPTVQINRPASGTSEAFVEVPLNSSQDTTYPDNSMGVAPTSSHQNPSNVSRGGQSFNHRGAESNVSVPGPRSWFCALVNS